jgi:hypothetical protein
MISVKMLNFYNVYMNKIITFYYVIENNDVLNLMELGYYAYGRKLIMEAESDDPDIENNIRPKQLSIIHPDDC